jgi:hypothetical protein
MARGWESKSVESQQEEAEPAFGKRAPLTDAQQKLQALELSRKRIVHEMTASKNPRFLELKRKALDHLDAEAARLAGEVHE